MCHVNLHKHKSLLFNSKFNTHKFTHVYLPIYIFSPFPQSVLFWFLWYNFFYGVSLYTCRYTHTHTHTSALEFKARKGTILCHLPLLFAPLFLSENTHSDTHLCTAHAWVPPPLCHLPQWLPPKWSASSSNMIIALPHQKSYLINNNSTHQSLPNYLLLTNYAKITLKIQFPLSKMPLSCLSY